MEQLKPAEGDAKYLYRMRNTKLMMIEGDLEAIGHRLSILTTTDFSKFLKSQKKVATVAQQLDDIGIVDLDFIAFRPQIIQQKKIVSSPNQLIIEHDYRDEKFVKFFCKELSKTTRVAYYDLSEQIHSYRLFSLTKTYKVQKEVRGTLLKQMLPPEEHRPMNSGPDEFLEIGFFHPRTHRLWINMYSPNPELSLESDGVKQAELWHYQAMRYFHGIPEFRECFDLTPKECQMHRLELLKNRNEYIGKTYAESQTGQAVPKFVMASKEKWDVSGECIGFPSDHVNMDFQIPRGLYAEKPDGSRPFKVIASRGNIGIGLLQEGIKERIFETKEGIYLHVFDPRGFWSEEVDKLLKEAEIEKNAIGPNSPTAQQLRQRQKRLSSLNPYKK